MSSNQFQYEWHNNMPESDGSYLAVPGHGSRAGTPEVLAHVFQVPQQGSWKTQRLDVHLHETARRAAAFAQTFGSDGWAELAGRLHDLGKAGPDFQSYLRTRSGFDPTAHLEGVGDRVDHSTAGAIWAETLLGDAGRVLAYLITGHHSGLLDWTAEAGASLSARLGKTERLDLALGGAPPDLLPPRTPPTQRPRVQVRQDAHLWIRMLFSCLVDADFLDTEAFMDPQSAALREGGTPDLACLKGRLDRHLLELSSRAPDSRVNQVRRDVLAACRAGAGQAPGLFSLTVPTGGGKTLASVAFALEHALRHHKRRIIVVIPYTSIIEQTAETLAKVFGPGAVLEHHSNLDSARETRESRLATENWDAPIVVTTNVQFFESLFAAKTSACRKLHNVVDSIVILDEAQMLPSAYLKPILGVLGSLTRLYGVSAVLCTATQPALQGFIGTQQARFQGLEGVRELMANPSDLARRLRRVELRFQHPELQPVAWDVLARELSAEPQVLCIVNTRKDCRMLHAQMPEGTIHLSALMCAQHRSDVIAALKVALAAGRPLRVISTQLVEAGVDLDFPVVYRALAGLDSMAQAAGRCNREGRLPEGRLGRVVLFAAPGNGPRGLLGKGAEAGREVLRRFPEAAMRLDPEAFRTYFERFYAQVNTFDEQNIEGLLTDGLDRGHFQFRSAADAFRLVDDTAQVAIVVRYGTHGEKVRQIIREIQHAGPSRDRLRALQRFTVTVPDPVFRALRDQGDLEEVAGLWVQAADELYDDRLGLCVDPVRWNPEKYVQ